MIRFAPFATPFAAAAFAVGLAAAPAAAATEVEVFETPAGHTVWLVQEDAIPMVALEISFSGGASRDPEGREGVASFLAAMLDEGAGEMDSAAFAEAEELAGARLGFDAGRDGFSISARFLTSRLEEGAALLRTAIAAPRFDAEPLERVRRQLLSGIRSDATDPGAIAGKAWRAALFPDDPYGRPTGGTEESVAAITAEDLRAARARLLNTSATAIGVVGDVTAEEAAALVDGLLEGLPSEAWTPLPMAEMSDRRGLEVIELDVPQSVARLVAPGLLRDDPDFIPAFVMNHVLGGGGFSSRLTTEVREKRGLTYSVWSYLAPTDRAGLWAAGVSSDNARIAEAIEVMTAEVARMAEEGVSEEELAKAKRYLTGAYPLRFDSNAKIAGILTGLQRAGLGPEYIAERNGLIEAVTAEDVARVAARLMDPDALKIVVVGSPEGLEPTN